MNNWRLLLLALVAVFQPITSLTERNLVDGRQQCCDRQTDTLLRDSRPSFYGTERLGKTSLPEHRLNFRDETREDQQLKQRDSVFTSRSMERSLLNIRERVARRSRSAITRSNRVEYRSDRIARDDNIERVIDLQQRNRIAGPRISMQHYNVRTNVLSSRNSLHRQDNRINRLGNERQERYHSQRTKMHITSENMDRQTPIRVIRDRRMSKEDFDRVNIKVSRDSRRDIARDRVNGLQRKTITRDDVTRNDGSNNERRELERHAEQRRSLSENFKIVHRVQNIHVNSKDERQENDERFNVNRKFMAERLVESRQQNDDRSQSREDIRENTGRRISRERIQMDRRDIRDSRLMNDRNVRYGNVETRRDTRNNERQSRETRNDQFAREGRVEFRASRRMRERNNLVRNQRARSVDFERIDGNRVDSRLSRSVEMLAAREDATLQIRTDRRRERDTSDRIRNVESVRVRDVNSVNNVNKVEAKNEPIANWQYLFYTVQAVYLCGLAIQILTPNHSEKSKLMSLRWWPSSTQRLIKVD